MAAGGPFQIRGRIQLPAINAQEIDRLGGRVENLELAPPSGLVSSDVDKIIDRRTTPQVPVNKRLATTQELGLLAASVGVPPTPGRSLSGEIIQLRADTTAALAIEAQRRGTADVLIRNLAQSNRGDVTSLDTRTSILEQSLIAPGASLSPAQLALLIQGQIQASPTIANMLSGTDKNLNSRFKPNARAASINIGNQFFGLGQNVNSDRLAMIGDRTGSTSIQAAVQASRGAWQTVQNEFSVAGLALSTTPPAVLASVILGNPLLIANLLINVDAAITNMLLAFDRLSGYLGKLENSLQRFNTRFSSVQPDFSTLGTDL